MNPEQDEGKATGDWLVQLRARLVQVTRRRVAPDAVEDIVQDALRIVVERGLRRPGQLAPDGQGALAFAFQVLRNVIGNHYQKERTRRLRLVTSSPESHDSADPAPGPLCALVSEDATEIVRSCLERLAGTDDACARRLRALAGGASPGELARAEAVDEPAFYRRLYRCRLKLRALLEERGFFA